jgi:tRNA (guanine-N7-)-methyltransferase
MRQSSKLSPTAAAIELVLQNYFAPLDLVSVFGRVAPLEVDLGCGDGSFLAALAQQDRHKDFLGTERLLGRVRGACRKIAQSELSNARILRIESAYAVRHLFPQQSVDRFHLLFPDPWPKRRHNRRRIVTEEFLESIHRALAPHGILQIATDQTDYFELMRDLASRLPGFAAVPEAGASPATTFQKHFQQHGIKIHRLALRKVSLVR